MTIRGKGKKFRLVPLNLDARKAVKGWLAIRDAETDTLALFVSQLGGPAPDNAQCAADCVGNGPVSQD